MPKGVYKRRSKREDILQAAAKVYAHYGFEGATIERMAEAAGVSSSLVIEHFGNKQGVVKAIVEQAVAHTWQKLLEIDQTPGITLAQREWQIHGLMKQNREEWCLILGTILVPSFQFQQRGALARLLDAMAETVTTHAGQLRCPTAETARAYAYTALCLHTGYVFDAREDDFCHAMKQHLNNYLLTEEKENCHEPES